MNKQGLSFSDVEHLLSEMARHDLHAAAQEAAQTELMRGAARGEIRRVFFRRRCLRFAGSVAMLAALAGAFSLLHPEGKPAHTMATALPKQALKEAVAGEYEAEPESFPEVPAISYSATLGGRDNACDVVIYSVPL